MWCTKSIGVAALVVSVLCNTGQFSKEMGNVRVDDEQEPFATMTIADDSGPSSTLFGACLAPSRTVEIKLYSIEIPKTSVEFIRHVPDSHELMISSSWESVTSQVSGILECADAAYAGGFPMFKYNDGNNCNVSHQMYDLNYVSACETEKQDAVFISNAASQLCKLPQLEIAVDAYGTNKCLTIFREPMTYQEAVNKCQDLNCIPHGKYYRKPSYEELFPLLKANNYVGTGDFFYEGVYFDPYSLTWNWVTGSVAVSSGLMLSTPPTSSGYAIYMKGTAQFKFDFALMSSFKAGIMCMC